MANYDWYSKEEDNFKIRGSDDIIKFWTWFWFDLAILLVTFIPYYGIYVILMLTFGVSTTENNTNLKNCARAILILLLLTLGIMVLFFHTFYFKGFLIFTQGE